MARRKRDENQGSKIVRNQAGLREPFPAHPTRPTRHAVYARYPSDAPAGQSRLVVLTFAADYSAKKFVDVLIAGGGYKWMQPPAYNKGNIPDTIVTDGNVQIRIPGKGMEEVIEYEYTHAEAEWELPREYLMHAASLRLAPNEVVNDNGEVAEKKSKREPKPEKAKVDKSALVSVADIAEQMGIEARDARQALRKAKMEKPTSGWWFSPEKVEEIKAIIKKGLK